MAWIRAERVGHALHNLSEWRKDVPDQGSKHLLPLLALLEGGAGALEEINFNERPHEYDFWDRYFRLGGDAAKPYFNPLTLRRSEANFPHSNAATIRKNTFALKWRGATRYQKEGGEFWQLAPDYADIFRDKGLTKATVTARVPVVDLAAILFRKEAIDVASAKALEGKFRSRFPMSDADYSKIFVFHDEEPGRIFSDDKPGPSTDEQILKALIADEVTPGAAPPAPAVERIEDTEDPILTQVQELLKLGTSGIILSGPPGTGKTYYAHKIAKSLVEDVNEDVFPVQFHPSYGYEDFVEGYRPDDTKTSGFKIVDKTFLRACSRAAKSPEKFIVVIIDEINRGDPSRIFGELLTYIERSYRNKAVVLPFSGNDFVVPQNVLIIGTMNPHDRSVSFVDAAFIRRFDHISMEPSRDHLEQILSRNGMSDNDSALVGDWFEGIQGAMPVKLGHALFSDVRDTDTLKTLWRYRIRPTLESLMELNQQSLPDLLQSFDALTRRLEGALDG